MATAKFVNFSNESFTGFWNGKPRTFKPGQPMILPDWLARHYAKHLTNRELLKGTPDGENYTSPKKPEEVKPFMDLFNKAYFPIATPEGEDGELDSEIASLNQPDEPSMNIKVKDTPKVSPTSPGSTSGGPAIISAPIGDDEDFEENANT